MEAPCSVSFVVTSRNDDHGGNMLRRLKLFTESLLEQANRHSLSGELIIVEWNPPAGPRLHEALHLAAQSDSFSIRFIEVPPEAHRRFRNSDVIPLFQMIAKNVGIRRARGNFVVATNPDLLFSDRLMSFLASRDLREDTLYRIDRHDVPAEVPDNASIPEKIAWCDDHVLRVHTRRGSFPPVRLRARFKAVMSWFAVAHWQRMIAALSSWSTMSRAAARLRKILAHRIGRLASTRAARILYTPRHLLRRLLWGVLRLTDPLPVVHTNGCGDFTLLCKTRWLTLRGYPELPLWSMHIDALLCYMAVAAGIREEVLRGPAKLFHMEHGNSWVVLSPAQRLKTFASKPWIDIGLLSEMWEAMYRSRQPVEFNDASWGMADWDFEEVCIVAGKKQYGKIAPRKMAG